jgi:hypothetical protein
MPFSKPQPKPLLKPLPKPLPQPASKPTGLFGGGQYMRNDWKLQQYLKKAEKIPGFGPSRVEDEKQARLGMLEFLRKRGGGSLGAYKPKLYIALDQAKKELIRRQYQPKKDFKAIGDMKRTIEYYKEQLKKW